MTSAPSASARHHTGHRREIQANIWNTGFCYYSSANLPGMGTIPCFTDGTDVFLVVSCVRSSRAAISDFLGCFSGRYFTLSMFECHVRFERIFDKISEYVKLQNRLMLLYQSLPLQYVPISSSAPRPLGTAYFPILLTEVEQEQRPSGNEDRQAIVLGAGLCDNEGERAYIAYAPHCNFAFRTHIRS